MNKAQKIAWSLVIAMSLGSLLGAIAVVLHYLKIGSPKPFVALAVAVMGVGLFLTFFVFKKDKGKVTFDERDVLIHKRAASAGFIATYAFFVTFCSVVLNSVGINGQVPGYMLLILVAGGFVVMMLAKAMALIIQYGWRDKGKKS